MDGQMTIFDYVPAPPKEPASWLLPCDTCLYEINGCCDCDETPDDYCVNGSKYKPNPQKNCLSCGHYRTIVDAYTCKPLYKACCPGDSYSYTISDPDTHCCEYWEEIQK